MSNSHALGRLFAILFAILIITAPIGSALAAGYIQNNEKNVNKQDAELGETSNYPKDKIKTDTNEDTDKKENDPREKLRELLSSLQIDPTSQLTLKQNAYKNISAIILIEEKNNKDLVKKLDEAKLHIAGSIDDKAWYDNLHLVHEYNAEEDDKKEIEDKDDDKNKHGIETTVFKEEKLAAINILEIISKNKGSTIDNDLLIEILLNLIQADRNIAQTSITDARRAASLYAVNPLHKNDEKQKNLEKAQKEFDDANEKIRKGEPIDAIEHFEKAWKYATTELLRLDAVSTPVIVFDSIRSKYINNTKIILSGHVEDAAVYTMPNVTIEVNGVSSILNLTEGMFETTLKLKEGENYINATAADYFGNTGTNNITLIADTTPPEVAIIEPEDNEAIRGIREILARVYELYLKGVTLSIDDKPVSDNLNYTFDTLNYSDGIYNVSALAVDFANNTAYDRISVTVDNTPPALKATELTDNPTLENPAYRINGTVELDAILVINGTTVPHSGSFEYATNVTGGTNIITVTATDAAGNVATWTKTRLVDTDNLPDYYEINVTGTDPLNGDSDSSKTAKNEAGNGIKDDMEILGSAELPSIISMRIGANPLVQDTDNDGLTDKYELLKLGLLTNVTSAYTNGVSDASADIDKDGLVNLEEQSYGTDPLVLDTDKDGLSDKEEITAGTDPLAKDTDGDGLDDDSELRLGTNPNNPDSNGNGVPDSKETYLNQKVTGEVATIVIDGVGDVSKNTTVVNASGYVALADMPGSIGRVVDINASSAFTSATISIPYNETDLHGVSENDLKMYYINESDHSINFLNVQGVDTANNVVWGKTNHFSTYGIVSYSSYMSTWNSGSNPTIPEYTYGDKINIKANVHNTGDAAVNDNVLVYFYAGNPDAGGSYLGSATITGGISQGGTKTAVLYGYTIKSSAVDIYVKVDPLNAIVEKSETNNKAYKTLSIGPQNFDSDSDGLTDYDETNGMRTAFGIIRTDPNNRDTDGDGLTDYEEMGTRYYNYYYSLSNPTLIDSDNDGLDDIEELDFGTSALNRDSDNDGIIDSIDTDPLVKNLPLPSLGVLEIARDIVVGAVFGESGIEGGSLNWLVGVIASSHYYLVGWIGFSLVPVVGAAADARDAVQAFINGDELGAALNAAGALSGLGDAVKVSGAVGLFVTKYPSKAGDVGKVLVKYVLKYVPFESVKLGTLDAIYGGAATALKSKGITISEIEELINKGLDLKHLDNVLSGLTRIKGYDTLVDSIISGTKGAIFEAETATKYLRAGENVIELEGKIPLSEVDILIQKGADSFKIIETKDIYVWAAWTKETMNAELGNKIAAFTGSYGKGVEIIFEFKGNVPKYVKDYITRKVSEGYNVKLVEVI